MPILPKSFLSTCCLLATFYLQTDTKGANIIATHQKKPYVISTVDAYKNTTLLDTNQLMVALKPILSTFYVEFKYATQTNFTGKILYNDPAAYLRLPAARALQTALDLLKNQGLTLKLYDAYRPYAVTKAMWKVVPDSRYAADPAFGSGHNRGAAVDVTLAELSTGKELEMPTAFDDFTEKAHHNYAHANATALANRQILKTVMEQAGFVALSTEWWHYSLPNAAKLYPLLDISFLDLNKLSKPQ